MCIHMSLIKNKTKLTLKNCLKSKVKTYNIWKFPIFLNILNRTQAFQFLMGAASEKTDPKWLSTICFSKNNVDIFSSNIVRFRCFAFYNTFRWLKRSFFSVLNSKRANIMFASHTPVYANLMAWAGLMTNCDTGVNRWLNGNISAQIRIKAQPNFLFMPDPEQNKMITREAYRKHIPIITIANSDSVFNAGVVLVGNNRAFRYVSQLAEMVIRLTQLTKLQISYNDKVLSQSVWFRARLGMNTKISPMI